MQILLKSSLRWASFFALFLSLACMGCTQSSPKAPTAPQTHAGISLGLFASDPHWDYGPLLQEMKAHNAKAILLVIPLYQPNIHSSSVYLRLPETTIRRSMKQVKKLGLDLSVMPIVQLQERQHSTEWRGVLAPSNPDIWWQNYSDAITRVASWAEAEGASRFVVGSELSSLESEKSRWEGLIKKTRDRFSGVLVYSANWDHYKEVPFWRSLQEIGITAYFPLPSTPLLHWQKALSEMATFASQQKRPLTILEYGYPSIDSASQSPWDEFASDTANPALQKQLIEIALKALNASEVKSSFLWNWFGSGKRDARGFSPRGKPAASHIKKTFPKIDQPLTQ